MEYSDVILGDIGLGDITLNLSSLTIPYRVWIKEIAQCADNPRPQ